MEVAERLLGEQYPLERFSGWLSEFPEGYVVATMDGERVGFAIALHERGETRLLMLSVDDAHRRMGIARAIISELLLRLHKSGHKYILLEVRESNRGAIAFYESIGFTVTGMIRGYYSSGETALVMGRTTGGA